jgi:CRISPR-associated protein Csm4
MTMQIQCWHIHGEGFHFGLHGLGQEETAVALSSDSLFGALLACLADLHGGKVLEDFMQPFLAGEPPFVISSTFPLAGEVRFLPIPRGWIRGEDEKSSIKSKELKKISFVSKNLFTALINGAKLNEIYADSHKLQGSSVLVGQEEFHKLPKHLQIVGAAIWDEHKRPRVTLGRGAQNASLFFTGRVTYAQGCGLWFGIRWNRETKELQLMINELLVELGHAGLGGERSAGFGGCRIEEAGEMDLPNHERRAWVNLSRYLPQEDEIPTLIDPEAAYSLVHVGGWLDSPVSRGQRRRAVNLISEGSLFGPVNRVIPGRVVDVRPSYSSDLDPLGHPVYRCGLALAVGLKGEI